MGHLIKVFRRHGISHEDSRLGRCFVDTPRCRVQARTLKRRCNRLSYVKPFTVCTERLLAAIYRAPSHFWEGRDDEGNRMSAAVYAVWLEHRTAGSTKTEKLPVVLYR